MIGTEGVRRLLTNSFVTLASLVAVVGGGCASRRYEIRDLGQVAVAVKGTPVLPADPAVQRANFGKSTIVRTDRAVLFDGHAAVKDGKVFLHHDTTWSGADDPEQQSSPQGGATELTLRYDHVIYRGQTPAAPGVVYQTTQFYDVALRTPWSNVRVVDRHGLAPGIGLTLIVLGATSFVTGAMFSYFDLFSGPASYMTWGGLGGFVGGVAFMWPWDHERWRGF